MESLIAWYDFCCTWDIFLTNCAALKLVRGTILVLA